MLIEKPASWSCFSTEALLSWIKKRIDLGVVVGDRCVERHRDPVVPGDDFQRTPEIGFLHLHLNVSLTFLNTGRSSHGKTSASEAEEQIRMMSSSEGSSTSSLPEHTV